MTNLNAKKAGSSAASRKARRMRVLDRIETELDALWEAMTRAQQEESDAGRAADSRRTYLSSTQGQLHREHMELTRQLHPPPCAEEAIQAGKVSLLAKRKRLDDLDTLAAQASAKLRNLEDAYDSLRSAKVVLVAWLYTDDNATRKGAAMPLPELGR